MTIAQQAACPQISISGLSCWPTKRPIDYCRRIASRTRQLFIKPTKQCVTMGRKISSSGLSSNYTDFGPNLSSAKVQLRDRSKKVAVTWQKKHDKFCTVKKDTETTYTRFSTKKKNLDAAFFTTAIYLKKKKTLFTTVTTYYHATWSTRWNEW